MEKGTRLRYLWATLRDLRRAGGPSDLIPVLRKDGFSSNCFCIFSLPIKPPSDARLLPENKSQHFVHCNNLLSLNTYLYTMTAQPQLVLFPL